MNLNFLIATLIITSSVTITAPFTRGPGYWTNPSQENTHAFFKALTPPKSQREDWYRVTPYIAEFWCTLSNAGFVYVGIKHQSPELLFAGCASIVSHAIPKQWLLYVDKLGVALVLTKAMREYATLKENPTLLIPVITLGIINGADAYLARHKGLTWPHVVWHLSAAFVCDILLQQMQQLTQR